MISDLQQGCGRDKVKSILGELEAAKYLVVDRLGHDEDGHFIPNTYKIHERPVVDDTPSEPPFTEKPLTVNPQLHNTESNTQYKESSTLSTGDAVERDLDEPEVDLFGAIPKIEGMRNVHKPTKVANLASEPNMPVTPYKAIVAEAGEEVVQTDEPAGKPKKERKPRERKEGVTPAECINPMKSAIMKAFGWTWKGITSTEKGQVYNASKQLCEVEFPVDSIKGLYDFCAEKFDDFGPMALTKHQSDYRKEHKPRQIAPELLAPQKPVVPIGIRSLVQRGWDAVREYEIDLAYWGIDPSEVGVRATS